MLCAQLHLQNPQDSQAFPPLGSPRFVFGLHRTDSWGFRIMIYWENVFFLWSFSMNDRPNLLFLMTDQHRWDALGCVRPEVKTPTLDALASRGIRFEQAVCQNPQCVASRYSLCTGLYPSQIGVRNNNQAIQRDEDMPLPTLFERLQGLGYQSIGSGKTHWYMGMYPGAGRDIREPQRSTRGFDWRYQGRMSTGNARERGSVYYNDEAPEQMRWMLDYERKVGPHSGGESFAGYMGCEAPYSSENMRESWLTTKALEAIQRCHNRDQAWHLYLSFDFPHAPLAVPKDYENLYSLDDIPDVDLPPDHVIRNRHFNMWHSDGILEQWQALGERERRQVWRRYYSLCSYVDDQFGRVIDTLEEQNELDNTFILFSSDHGDSLGERGRFSKYSLYEASVRVPLLIAGPGVHPDLQGTVDPRPAELVDIVPTFLDAAGEAIPDALPGESLLAPSMRRGAFAEFHSHGFDEVLHAPAYMWRTREWKLILWFEGNLDEMRQHPEQILGELYRLAEDPDERNNLYDDPGCLVTREALTRELLMHLAFSWSHFPRYDSYSFNRAR